MTLYVVLLKEQQTVYGTFVVFGEAKRFADWLTAEVDPAEVVTLVPPHREMLAWYAALRQDMSDPPVHLTDADPFAGIEPGTTT